VYQPLYGPKGSVIFDHPYNAQSGAMCTGVHMGGGGAPISQFGAASALACSISVSAGGCFE
jgi:hypothetical protein